MFPEADGEASCPASACVVRNPSGAFASGMQLPKPSADWRQLRDWPKDAWLAQFCVNINGDLNLWGCVWKKALQGICACCFLSRGLWCCFRWTSSRPCVGRGGGPGFSQRRLVPREGLSLGGGVVPQGFNEYSFWMQDPFNKIVLSSVWYYMLIITV